MITVGLDFGTHQTKVCVENIKGAECSYSFIKFENEYRQKFYTLPSVINVGKDGRLSYGYLPIPKKTSGRLIRYFKQAAFCTNTEVGMCQINAMYFSCWYLAYILFDLEEKFGTDFSIQMGAPSDSSHLHEAKQIAARILASAYRLVEDVFLNDKEAFLATDMRTLVEKTTILPYSDKLKEKYNIFVFPEAYACLKPLTSRGRIANGMNLMVDIGGGTTDISFFTIEKDKNSKSMIPQVYDFFSIAKGLNYLTGSNANNTKTQLDSNVHSQSEIIEKRRISFIEDVNRECNKLLSRLTSEFRKQAELEMSRLFDALKSRPLIYCGGGSTFKVLQTNYGGFKDKKQISEREWDTSAIEDVDEIIRKGLCPILSTAYGLSIHATNDDIVCKPFRDIFEGIRSVEKENARNCSSLGAAYGGFSYTDDDSAWK